MSTFTTKDDTQIRNGGIGDSSQFYKDAGGHRNTFDCIKAFSETDFAEDLKQFDVPTLIIMATTTRSFRLAPQASAHRSWSKMRP
ncbi:MAG: hypothetical protein Q8K74_00785 [Candidatus Nitrotoga sp.]|nr:hypothetical protein [Candidatus Nitrotoga sp.]MDP1854577.1 hypothetical protein [Candidatus Nitrotoga sp.]